MFVVLLTALALPSTLMSQVAVTDPDNPLLIPTDNTSFGGVSGEFLLLGSSARGMAMGGSFATIVDDVNSLYYNPAGLTRMDGFQAALTIMPYFADTDYYWAGLAFPFADGDFGFGIFLGRFGFSDSPVFTEADPEGLSGETFGVDEVVGGISFAHQFIDRFSAGVSLKLISDNLASGGLGGASANAFALDFGTNFTSEVFGNRIALSFVVQNLGGNLQHTGEALSLRQNPDVVGTPDQRLDPTLTEVRATPFPLPRLFRVGLGYDLFTNEQTRWTLAAEFVESNNTNGTFGGGTEFAWQSTETPIGAALRGSYQYQPDEDILSDAAIAPEPDNRGLDGLAVGGGLFYRVSDRYRFQFDYAYRHFGVLGSVDVFSVTFGIAK
jgi:hypothetical protein